MKTNIEIFNIGKTQVNRDEVKRWLKFMGADDFVLPEDGAVTNSALLIALAGKRCYKAFDLKLNTNLSRVRSDYGEYFDNILKSGHGSVLEHAVYNFAFENVSRVFTGEMNRHRAGWAISEGSMRFIRYSKDIPYWEPDSIKGPDVLDYDAITRVLRAVGDSAGSFDSPDLSTLLYTADGEPEVPTLDQKKHATRVVFERAFEQQAGCYAAMEAIWKDELAPDSKFKAKKEITSLMRRVVGMGVSTGGVWSGNIRALRHVLTMRCASAAEEEILHVFSRVAKWIRDEEPMLFGDFEQKDVYWVPRYLKV